MFAPVRANHSSGTVGDLHPIPILITLWCEPIADAKVSILFLIYAILRAFLGKYG